MARILVIDDVAGVRRSIVASLKRHGHEVEEAANGADGVAKAARVRPDLVVTDMLMPGMDGIDTIERLREIPGGGAIKVLAISGGGSLVPAADALIVAEAIADGVLPKPFDNTELEAAVTALVGGR
ncbi:response regulator [Salinarimonas ramus]|uniref:Response regulator n=1 Tax=Salinarimonas ramus TaxID=690164 RepID=A0A917Q669_9HYPH|nr:response regulator [Salinarimonas ramus]GGK29060.1 response regulator [Salinarimonas ramus]